MYGFKLFTEPYICSHKPYICSAGPEAPQISPPQGNSMCSSHNRKLFAEPDAVSLFQCSQLTSSVYLACNCVGAEQRLASQLLMPPLNTRTDIISI